LKRIITLLIIYFFLSTSLGVFSQSNHTNHRYEHLKFICYDKEGIHEEKYQRYLKLFDEIDTKYESELEVENTEFPISTTDDGLMDSPWPMKCHDIKHSGRSPFSTINNNGAELWKFRAGSLIQGGPIVDNNGIIYFGSFDSYIYALYPDGNLKWQFKTDGWIWSSPAIGYDGTIYTGSWDDYLYALYPNGTLKWEVDSGGTISSSPVIAEDGTIYFGNMVGFNGGNIVAVNPNGSIKWEYETGYKITSDPAIGDDGTVYIGSGDTYFYAINPNGTLKWQFKTGDYVKAPPSIAEDGTVYFGSFDDYLYALHQDGSLKWKYKLKWGTETNPSIGPDGTIYVGCSNLYAINSDGTLKWTFNLGENQHVHQSSPAVSADGTIYVGTIVGESSGGDIIAINPDGTEQWRLRIAGEWVESSPCIGENGVVYIGSSFDDQGNDYGYLYSFGHGENVNNPPNSPIITGPNSGKTGETYPYSFTATDPDNDDISYYIDWGDGSNSSWQGPYSSGTGISLSHSWSNDGSFSIKAKAKDSQGSESTYATLQVTMPKNKLFQHSLFFEKLLYRFPILKQIFSI
jgi:outer membrane protein assembly factor BamB